MKNLRFIKQILEKPFYLLTNLLYKKKGKNFENIFTKQS